MPDQLYEQKLNLFQKLAKLSEKLAGFSSDDLVGENTSLEELETFLLQREKLIAKINVIDGEINKSKDIPDKKVICFKKSLAEIGEIIKKSDAKAELAIKEGLSQLRQKTKKIREGKQSSRAYSPSGDAGEGVFVDKRR